MIVVCVLGWALALGAGFVLGAEVVSFATSGKYHIIAGGELWFDLHRGSLNLSQAVIQRYLHPWLWEPAIVTVLRAPASALFGVPGLALIWFSVVKRRKKEGDPASALGEDDATPD
jgi:hypothetical protein